jgi:DnaJ-domain-containing protein 1
MRSCDHPSCSGQGLYPAPRGRDALHSYYWFCLDHVREYNRAWNFYAGMSQEEVEEHVREDIVGWRPTWPMGVRETRFTGTYQAETHDPFGFFGAARKGGEAAADSRFGWLPSSPEGRALAVFDLEPLVTLATLKTRYKELVKRHHPDANGGDKASEEKLKRINVAYRVLKAAFCA